MNSGDWATAAVMQVILIIISIIFYIVGMPLWQAAIPGLFLPALALGMLIIGCMWLGFKHIFDRILP